jgi:hypothetical protein
MYKLIHGSTSVRRLSDGAVIPDDPRNLDRIAYLEWLQSNTPEPADLPPVATVEERRAALLRPHNYTDLWQLQRDIELMITVAALKAGVEVAVAHPVAYAGNPLYRRLCDLRASVEAVQ